MIKKENKLIQITLDPETLQLLYSLADRFHISKTELIKQAIKEFGATKKHHYTVFLNRESNKKTIKELIKEIDDKNKEDTEEESKESDNDDLPF